MTTDLIQRLRTIASKGVSVWGDLQMEAADALERKDAEIDALRAGAAKALAMLKLAQKPDYEQAIGNAIAVLRNTLDGDTP